MDWDIIETAPASPVDNMRFDRELLGKLSSQTRPILHLYEWDRPSLTFGYFIRLEKFVNLSEAKNKGLDWAERPTGGGIVFHLWDIAFSVLIPASSALFSINTLDNYRWVNHVVKQTVERFLGVQNQMQLAVEIEGSQLGEIKDSASFCMAQPTRYDVIFNGKKVAGAAQRKTKDGFLHQGTISLVPPDEEWLNGILYADSVKKDIIGCTVSLMEDRRDLVRVRTEMVKLLKDGFLRS